MSTLTTQQTAPSDLSFEHLFPLPLTTFESFMIVDGRAGYPMMCDLEIQFRGCIDRGAFESALSIASARSPLFTCLVEPGPSGEPCWVPSGSLPSVDWASLGTPLDDSYDAFTDLTQEPGLRIYVRQGQDRSTVLLHFHHACADAMGAYGFVEDLLAGYAGCFSDGPTIEFRPLEPERLTRRGEIGLNGRSLMRRLTDPFIGVHEVARFFLQNPRPLSLGKLAEIGDAPLRPGFVTHVCTGDVVKGIRQAATAAGATVNDVLMRDLFLTLRRWNDACDGRPSRRRLRILMPQNLREREDRAMPSANAMSFAFVTRKARSCDRPEQLLHSIHEETDAVRRGQLSLYFLGALGSIHSAGALDWLLRRRFCFSTAVLTNVGDATRRFVTRFPRVSGGLAIGNLVYQNVLGVPPLRPLTRAAFALYNGANTLTICLKCDPRHYSPADARRLLDVFAGQLRVTAKTELPTAAAAAGE